MINFESKVDVVLYAGDLVRNLKPGCVLTTIIYHDAYGGFSANIATTDLSDATGTPNYLDVLQRMSKAVQTTTSLLRKERKGERDE